MSDAVVGCFCSSTYAISETGDFLDEKLQNRTEKVFEQAGWRKKIRVSNSSLRLLCWQLSLGGRWNMVVLAVLCSDVLREEERAKLQKHACKLQMQKLYK